MGGIEQPIRGVREGHHVKGSGRWEQDRRDLVKFHPCTTIRRPVPSDKVNWQFFSSPFCLIAFATLTMPVRAAQEATQAPVD